jgi:hypothetical protein
LTASAPATDALLNELLDWGVRYEPEYSRGLSNHLPMSLIALQRLGASAERLQAYCSSYAARLRLAPVPAEGRARPGAAVPTRRFGDVGAFPELRRYFLDELAEHGVARVLSRALPVLIPGIGAAAFHGQIRTAYGIEAGHHGEIASGLGYWAARYLRLRDTLPAQGPLEAPVWLAAIASEFNDWQAGAGLIFEDMQAVALSPRLQDRLVGLKLDGATLEQLTRFAVEKFVATRNFTVLHLITSAHALGVLLPYCDEPEVALHWYAVAFATALAAVHSSLHSDAGEVAVLSWSEIISRALRSDDDHDVKLVYTCSQLAALYPGPDFLRAASARMQ